MNDTSPNSDELSRWLREQGKSQQWLADELNRLRADNGIAGRVARATIWRWISRATQISLDDAVMVEAVTRGRVRAINWSSFASLLEAA